MATRKSNNDHKFTIRTAKLVRWLQVQVMIPSSLTFVVHPLAVQSRRVKFQATQISLPSALNCITCNRAFFSPIVSSPAQALSPSVSMLLYVDLAYIEKQREDSLRTRLVGYFSSLFTKINQSANECT